MALAGTDLKYYLSGGASNTSPGSSLGGAISSTQVGTNLFDDISSSESSSGDTEYRAIFVKNTSATDTAYNTKIWIESNTPSTSTELSIALCDEGASATMETVADESTAPTGPTFDVAEDEANALALGTLAPGAYYGIWVKRVVTTGAGGYANDGATLRVKGDQSP